MLKDAPGLTYEALPLLTGDLERLSRAGCLCRCAYAPPYFFSR